jgi:hypothetical protein
MLKYLYMFLKPKDRLNLEGPHGRPVHLEADRLVPDRLVG